MSDTTTVATINPGAARQEIDEFDEMFEPDELSESDFAVEPEPAKPSKAEKKALAKQEAEAAARAEQEAERQRVQALVPWKVLETAPHNGYQGYQQKGEIDTWADNDGRYPRRYRSYTREEWTQAIDALAEAVAALEETDSDYQRKTGLYVEERGANLLLLKAKSWTFLIQVPDKASTSGKKIAVTNTSADWSARDACYDHFADLLRNHIASEHRDVLLDICCQYMTAVRIRVNKGVWAAENPEHAHLLSVGR